MFSLCIPTIDRFDNFLSKYLVEYLTYELIDEIIITDENGNDVVKINTMFPDNEKIKLFTNKERLGPLLNKMEACSHAKNEWIALIDSDNFAPKDYFVKVKNYIETQLKGEKNVILAPCKARPNFDYSHLSGFIYKKGEFAKNNDLEKRLKKSNNCESSVLMNTGNYVINKYLTNNISFKNEPHISKSSACDVIYFNTLLFEQLDLNLHVVPELEYDHVVHQGSVYIQTASQHTAFNHEVHQRYFRLV